MPAPAGQRAATRAYLRVQLPWKLFQTAGAVGFSGLWAQVPSGFRLPEVDTSTIGLDFKNQAPTWGIVMWTADQLDISVRIDVSIGWLKDLLLEVEMTSETNVTGGLVARAVVGRRAVVVRGDMMTGGPRLR